RRPAAGADARRDRAAPTVPAPAPLDLARPVPAGGDELRDAGGRAGHDRIGDGRAARGGAAFRGAGPYRGADQLRPAPLPVRLGRGIGRGGFGTRLRVAMVSEHASPLAMLGGVDAGGQNTHVAELATALAQRGHEVRVYTRRDDAGLPEVVPLGDGVYVEHVPVGPAEPVPKDDLLPFMGEFGRWLSSRWTATEFVPGLMPDFVPDVVHAHFWRSGLAALTATASSRIPVVVTYHALGSIKRRFQGDKDTSPETRLGLERELGLLA